MKPPTMAFCLQRAADAARLAEQTHLAKIRNSLLQAERAWRDLAAVAGTAEVETPPAVADET